MIEAVRRIYKMLLEFIETEDTYRKVSATPEIFIHCHRQFAIFKDWVEGNWPEVKGENMNKIPIYCPKCGEGIMKPAYQHLTCGNNPICRQSGSHLHLTCNICGYEDRVGIPCKDTLKGESDER